MSAQTEKKTLEQVVKGDVLISDEYGARFVTEVAHNLAGQKIIYFSPEGEARSNSKARIFVDNQVTVDRFWLQTEVTVLKVENIWKAQLDARDAALDAVLKLAMSQAGPANPLGFEIVALLERYGVRI